MLGGRTTRRPSIWPTGWTRIFRTGRKDEFASRHASSRRAAREFPERRTESHRCGGALWRSHNRSSTVLLICRSVHTRSEKPFPRRLIRREPVHLLRRRQYNRPRPQNVARHQQHHSLRQWLFSELSRRSRHLDIGQHSVH